MEYREDKTVVGLKIGDGLHVYNELPYLDADTQTVLHEVLEEMKSLKKEISNAGDYTYFMSRKDWDIYECDDLQRKISYFLRFDHDEAVSVLGNLFVIREELYEDAQLDIYEIYVYTGEKDGWVKIHGHELPADKIIFRENMIVTEPVGSISIPEDTGHSTLHTKGKSVSDFISMLLVHPRDPEVEQPSVHLITDGIVSYEVGSTVIPSYQILFNPGKYQYKPHTTGATLKLNKVELGEHISESNSLNGDFGPIVVTESTADRLVVEYEITADNCIAPVNNLGEHKPEYQIKNQSGTIESKSALKGFRGIFYGYYQDSHLQFEDIKSSDIRALSSGPKMEIPSEINTDKMKQLILAVPNSMISGKKVTIQKKGTSSTQRVIEIPNIDVEGANGYESAPYTVFYVENRNADTSKNTYIISVESEV